MVVVYNCAKHFSLVLGHRFVATSIADRWFESQQPWRLACREATVVESKLLMCLSFSDGSDLPLSAKLEGVSEDCRARPCVEEWSEEVMGRSTALSKD